MVWLNDPIIRGEMQKEGVIMFRLRIRLVLFLLPTCVTGFQCFHDFLLNEWERLYNGTFPSITRPMQVHVVDNNLVCSSNIMLPTYLQYKHKDKLQTLQS